MMEKTQIYLAVPYSHPDKYIREERFLRVTKMAGWIMKQGYTVLSPITHGHPIALVTSGMPTDFEYWKKVCQQQMNGCKILAIYMLDGWASSAGIAGELSHAGKLQIPIIKFKSRWDFKKQMKSIKEFYDGTN